VVDDTTNTVMGEAVSDAAAWYDKADWIGIAARGCPEFRVWGIA
jgi:hypothetical protein